MKYYWEGEGSRQIRIVRQRRQGRKTAAGYIVAVFLGLPVFAVAVWVVVEYLIG